MIHFIWNLDDNFFFFFFFARCAEYLLYACTYCPGQNDKDAVIIGIMPAVSSDGVTHKWPVNKSLNRSWSTVVQGYSLLAR